MPVKFSGRTVAAIIEFPHNKILLIKRSTVVFRSYWALPGGKVESEETIEQAILREVKEETGLKVEIIKKIGEYPEVGVQNGIEYDYYLTCFLVKPVEGKFERQKEEIEKIKLFDLRDVPKRLAFKHSNMIIDYIQNLKTAKLAEEIKECVKCGLYKTRINAVPGEGPANAIIMICGQAPGRTEDKQGRPFVGKAGKLLDELVNSIGLTRDKIFITSIIKCFPHNNRPPKPDELKACEPYLQKQIILVRPKIILALGNYAVRTLLGKKLTLSKIHGQPQDRNGVIIFPTFHPAAAMRFPKIKALVEEDLKRIEKMLRNCIS